MCGRYRLSGRKEILAEHFDADFEYLDWEPRYNIAHTQSVPVIRSDQNSKRRVSLMRWGLIPRLGDRSEDWRSNDQCEIRDGCGQAAVPRPTTDAALSGSGGRFLRMVAFWQAEAALLLRRRRRGDLRLRGPVGSLASTAWCGGRYLHDPDHDRESPPGRRARPYAGHPPAR